MVPTQGLTQDYTDYTVLVCNKLMVLIRMLTSNLIYMGWITNVVLSIICFVMSASHVNMTLLYRVRFVL